MNETKEREKDMEATKLEAEVRGLRGKGPARRLRAQGKIPAVIYGAGIESTALTLDPKELVKALQGERGRNSLFVVEFGGKSEHAMVRDVAIDPVTRQPVHVDFFRIDESKPIDVEIPLTTRGRALGVQKGGKLTVKFRTLPVRCLPSVIPTKIEIDVTNVDLGSGVTVAELPLPSGVVVTLKPTQTVAGVYEEKAIVEEAPVAAAAAAAPAAAAAKAAPAAPAKPAGKK